MTITRFYDKTFTNKRQVYVGNKSSLQTIGTFVGHLQQRTPEDTEFIDLAYTKAWTIWCPVDTNIAEGDTIEWNGNVYSVRAIQKNATGNNQHLEVIVELKKTEPISV